MDVLHIAKSKTRKKILQLFFSFPDKKYYLRELERMLDISVANIRRELLSLEKNDLFKKEKIGNQVHFFLNKQSPIFDDVKRIVSKTIGVEALIKSGLKKVTNIDAAFIFGSFAREKEDNFSDIDLMIIGEPDENILISRISSIESVLKREINYNIFSIKDIKKGLKNQDVFLEEIMANPKIFVIGNENDMGKIIEG